MLIKAIHGQLKGNQKGTSVAEFAIVALVFFMILIGIIEFGRLLYTHNALTDAARRGARYAVLHTEAQRPCVKNAVVYGAANVNPLTCASSSSTPLISGLTPDHVIVDYAGSGTNPFGMNIGTATVSIQNYTFNLSIPLFSRTLTMPTYSTTLSAESGGVVPPDI